MHWGHALAVVLAGAAGAASAQTLPWPDQRAAPAPPMTASPATMPPARAPATPPPALGQQQPCVAEFVRLRGEVEKHSNAAKAANQRKAPREDICKQVSAMVAADTRWVKYSEDNASSCGIPADVVRQIKASHTRMLGVRKQVCEGPTAGRPALPSLSEALGTTRLPAPDTTTTRRGGTLDTLTGNPIR